MRIFMEFCLLIVLLSLFATTTCSSFPLSQTTTTTLQLLRTPGHYTSLPLPMLSFGVAKRMKKNEEEEEEKTEIKKTAMKLPGWISPSTRTRNSPFPSLSEILNSLDDVIDDFMGKRMGNGEVFYGQRKYMPSGRENTQGQYNGMGMSDKLRIDIARERKSEYWAKKKKTAASENPKDS